MTFPQAQTGLRGSFLLLVAAISCGCVDSDPASGFGSDDMDPNGNGDGDGDGDGENGGMEGDSPLDACGVPPMAGKVVLGYVPSWSDIDSLTDSLDFDTLTHIALAFTNPTGEGSSTELAWVEDATVHALVERAHAHDVKVLASIGGAAESDVIHASIQPDSVDAYIEELFAYVERYDLDGVDVDIEGGVVDETYGPFVSKLAARIRPEGKLITAAVAQWFQEGVVDEALFCFDFINLMAYDAAGGWSGPEEHSSRSLARSRALYWSNTRNYPAERIVIGLPFYGYCWGAGCPRDGSQISFRGIEELYPDALDEDWIVDEEADLMINFNSPATIQNKTEFSKQYGGVMIWEMSQDGSMSQLFTALKLGL